MGDKEIEKIGGMSVKDQEGEREDERGKEWRGGKGERKRDKKEREQSRLNIHTCQDTFAPYRPPQLS